MREMKDSGIEWIGEIPKDWQTIKVKYFAQINGRIGFRGYTSNDLVGKDEGAITLSPSNFNDMKMDYSKCSYISWYKYEESPEIKINNNDILFVKTGSSYGKSVIVKDLPQKATINPQLIVFKDIKINNKFFFYILQTETIKYQIELIKVGGTIPTLSQEKIYNFSLPIPLNDEQKKIADFLDEKCSEIDSITADIQKQIETLQQYKKSLVFKTISQGVNHTSLKCTDSSIWKNIPINWILRDIKYIFEIVKRIAGKEGYDVLSVTQKGIKVKNIHSNEGQIAESYSNYQFVYPTDYVMNHMDLLTGWVDCSKQFGVTSPDYRVFRLRDKENNDLNYFKYLMQSCYMSKIFYSLGQGVSNLGRWRLQTSVFNNFKIPLPSLMEQKEIADYLDAKCQEIDAIIAGRQKQLELIGDYKKSLIYEYVTGKKEVI